MTDVQIEAGTLTANREERVVSGMLLPFGEVGNTNLGRFSVDPGVFTVPADVTVLAANTDHKRENPVARFISAVETAAGIVASFKIGANPEGDALLAEIADETNPEARRKLSVEVTDVVLRGAKALSGRVFGAAFVKSGAFPSATLMASDVGELPARIIRLGTEGIVYASDAPGEAQTLTAVQAVVDGKLSVDVETTPDEVIVHTLAAEGGEDTTTTFIPETQKAEETVTLPNTLDASATTEPAGLSLAKLSTLYATTVGGHMSAEDFASEIKGQNGHTLFAALSDVKYDGTGGLAPVMGQPQWIGEVWSSLKYTQQVLPLFAHENLTGLTYNGFKWGTKPAGGDWAGNKANVPSNTLTVTPVTGGAVRYAVGHDIAREFVDFPVAGFFESYAAAVAEDYAKWADGKVAAAAVAGATALAGDALTTLPGGTANIGAAASAIIDGAVALSLTGTLPNFALVAPALYKSLLKTPNNNVLGYLTAALGLTEGDMAGFTIRPSASIAAGKVLVGAREAVTVYELPGAPIRVDALDLVKGGVDKAAFGYLAVNVNDSTALQLVTAAAA
jgi:hypothetical protein